MKENTPGQRAWRRLVHRKGAMVGLAFVVFFVLVAFCAPWIA
ncbi:MAG TPA: ABC transporter permease, partial [Casimicrobiaceae bacterium]|nr:ABC transporter permease [Casimicrobiaceae bacterium]